MDVKEAGSALDSLISSFNGRISELRELVIARNMFPATSIADLSEVDTAVRSMEFQMQAIKDRLREEAEAIPKAKKLIDLSIRQQKKLESMLSHFPSRAPRNMDDLNMNPNTNTNSLVQDTGNYERPLAVNVKSEKVPITVSKEKKGRSSAPRWYITAEELDSLSSYMRGRLTLEKINAGINDMATYADANAQIISAPKKKLSEENWEKALELRDISMEDSVKGKHFFLETDMKGSALKLDNTGKSILTVLRHLGRIHETRIRHHRVITLSKPQ